MKSLPIIGYIPSKVKVSKPSTTSSSSEIVAKEFVVPWNESRFSFKNFFIEYARFHWHPM